MSQRERNFKARYNCSACSTFAETYRDHDRDGESRTTTLFSLKEARVMFFIIVEGDADYQECAKKPVGKVRPGVRKKGQGDCDSAEGRLFRRDGIAGRGAAVCIGKVKKGTILLKIQRDTFWKFVESDGGGSADYLPLARTCRTG